MFPVLIAAAVMTQNISQISAKFIPEKRPKVLIVGFYHFANPGLDLVKSDLDDHLLPKRQAEIEALNAKLATFAPTKIAVEEPFLNGKTQSRYDAWLSGTHQLSANETEQVGFQLAKHLGLKCLQPIDTKLDMDFDAFMKKAGPKMLGDMQTMMGEMQKFMSNFKNQTVSENLRALNSAEADRITNGTYLRLLTEVNGEDHPGVDLVAPWWKRNLYWIANLSTVAKEPGDRVLLICGAGHASLLRSILKDSLDFEVVDALRYLP